MVIDTSALTAILRKEPERDALLKALVGAPTRLVSAVTALEAAMVIEGRYGPEAGADLELLLYTSRVQIVPFDPEQSSVAVRAWKKYGKGRHRAALNLGDCCVYALAEVAGEPVLCIGGDFPETDVPAVQLE